MIVRAVFVSYRILYLVIIAYRLWPLGTSFDSFCFLPSCDRTFFRVYFSVPITKRLIVRKIRRLTETNICSHHYNRGECFFPRLGDWIAEFFERWVQKLSQRWEEVVNIDGEYETARTYGPTRWLIRESLACYSIVWSHYTVRHKISVPPTSFFHSCRKSLHSTHVWEFFRKERLRGPRSIPLSFSRLIKAARC